MKKMIPLLVLMSVCSVNFAQAQQQASEQQQESLEQIYERTHQEQQQVAQGGICADEAEKAAKTFARADERVLSSQVIRLNEKTGVQIIAVKLQGEEPIFGEAACDLIFVVNRFGYSQVCNIEKVMKVYSLN